MAAVGISDGTTSTALLVLLPLLGVLGADGAATAAAPQQVGTVGYYTWNWGTGSTGPAGATMGVVSSAYACSAAWLAVLVKARGLAHRYPLTTPVGCVRAVGRCATDDERGAVPPRRLPASQMSARPSLGILERAPIRGAAR